MYFGFTFSVSFVLIIYLLYVKNQQDFFNTKSIKIEVVRKTVFFVTKYLYRFL